MGICCPPEEKKPTNYVDMTRSFTLKNTQNAQNAPNIQSLPNQNTPYNENVPSNENNLKLELTLDNCTPGSKYYVVVEFLNTTDSFQTETVICHGNFITFNKTYLCTYSFEIPQLMRITVFKNDQNIGSFSPYLGSIVGSPNSTFRAKVSPDKPESIIISAKSIGDCKNLLIFNFMIKANKNVNFEDTKNKIYFMITSNNYKKVYSSELISKYGQFKTTSILKELLEPQFEVTFCNYRNEKIVTKSETPDTFTGQNNQVYLTLNVNNNDYYIYNNSQLSQEYSFIDYIKNGVQIALSIGIDFTRSNEINNPISLHRIIPGNFNDYEQAISSCGLIMAFYDYDQLFPVYGFGAIIDKNSKNANMCFNINFQQNPEIHTIDNVIEEYHKCLGKVFLYGPTYFSPIIKKEIELINRENNPLIYHVLMILTDGVIDDFNETIDAIIEASFLPFSLIIIGIGNADFTNMVILDGDKVPLISSNGVKRLRDVVQFVPFNKYRGNNEQLTKQVLEEIPRQVTEYYSMLKIYPNNLQNQKLRTTAMKNMNTII